MQTNALAQIISPVHALLHKVAAPPMESVGIQPERVSCYYSVSRQREPKFVELVKRLLAIDETFELRSPLCVFVSRSVKLTGTDSLDYSEWQVQFQVNRYDRTDEEVADVVHKQVEALIFEMESFLYD